VANEVWQQYCYFEFVEKDAEAALGTMSDDSHVLMEPLAIGGRGREGVYNFYHECSLAQLPADMTAIPVSQVLGENILAEEAVYQFTHDQLGTGADIFRQSVCAPPAKREHPGVFNDRFARSRSLLHFTACRVLGDPERAKLAVRNCWRRASRNPPGFRYDGAFRSRLVRLLIDEALAILHRPDHRSAPCPLL
jgi:hypothetical protein